MDSVLNKIKKYVIPSFMLVYSTTAISWIFIRIIFSNHELSGKYIYANRLINYRAGFIRRGLDGEIILGLSNISGLSLTSVIDFSSAVIWIILTTLFIHEFIRKKYPLFILTLPFFLGETILIDESYFLRQDSLILLIFIAMTYILTKKNFPQIVSFLLINLLFIFGILFHEAIFFFSFPILVLTLWNKTDSLIKSFLFFLPALIVFILCFLLPEESTPAEMLKLSPEINPRYIVCFLSFAQNLSLQWQKISETSAFFTISFLCVWITAVYCVCINFFKLKLNFSAPNNLTINTNFLARILLIQLVSVFPLFCCVLDWGRWIFLWVASSFAYFLLVEADPFNKIAILSKLNITPSRLTKISPAIIFLIAVLINCPFVLPLKANIDDSALFIIIKTFKEFLKFAKIGC